MTVAIFLGSLLAAMALGIPIAYSLLLCGVALMLHMSNFDAQILAQNLIEGANTFPLLAVPFFMLAGEIMNVGAPWPPRWVSIRRWPRRSRFRMTWVTRHSGIWARRCCTI